MDEDKSQSRAAVTQATTRDNIKILTSISEDIPSLLQSAGSAVALLSNSSTASSDLTLDQRQAEFKRHVNDYFSTLTQIQTALIKQTSELEDAKILPRVPEQQDGKEGIGSFDVAWLNSRSRDVGREKEKELIAEARAWLQNKDKRSNDDKMEE